MLHAIEGASVNSIYAATYHHVMSAGSRVPSRNGDTVELNPGIFTISDPTRRLVTCHGRPVNVAFALAEVLWILSGRSDVEMLKPYNSSIDQWSDDGLSFNAPYGDRLRNRHGWDQIEDVIHTLQTDPGSRQAVLSVWHVPSDRGWKQRPTKDDSGWVQEDGAEFGHWQPHLTADRACNVLCMMKIRDGKLNWTQIVRSNDLIWGVPYNVMQWTSVMEYIARRVGVEMGHYVHLADSLHVYDFNKPEDKVEKFDLYEQLAWVHHPMLVNRESMKRIFKIEETVRTHPDISQKQAIDIIWDGMGAMGRYWTGVAMILAAHRFYREKRDWDCLRTLKDQADPVFSLAQMRFYWTNRWKKQAANKDIHEDIELAVRSETLPANQDAVLEWMFR